MKNFLFTIVLFLFTFTIKAQVSDLPKYYIVNNDTLGIILTVEQVQKLDNDVELLNLFEKLQIDCENLTTHYIKIINSLEEKNILMEVSVKELKPHLLSWNDNEEEIKKIEKADLNYPILIFVNDNNEFLTIIDGHHRAQKAVRNGLKTIKAKIIPINYLPKEIRKVFKHIK